MHAHGDITYGRKAINDGDTNVQTAGHCSCTWILARTWTHAHTSSTGTRTCMHARQQSTRAGIPAAQTPQFAGCGKCGPPARARMYGDRGSHRVSLPPAGRRVRARAAAFRHSCHAAGVGRNGHDAALSCNGHDAALSCNGHKPVSNTPHTTCGLGAGRGCPRGGGCRMDALHAWCWAAQLEE